jgi:hypothetical protein
MYLYSATAVNATYSPTGQSSGKTSFEDVDNPGDYYAYASQHNFLSITAYTGAANTSPVYTTASSGSAGSPSVTGAAQFTTSAVHNVAYAWYLSAGVPTTTGTPHTARYTPVFGSSRDAPILVSTVNTTSASSLAYSWTAASTGWTMYFIEVFADGVSPTYFSKVVVSQTGGYRVSLSFDGSFDGGGNTFYWWVYINNTTYTGINFSAATSTTAINLKSEDFLALNAGDYLCVRCWRQAADAVRITNLSMMKLMVEKVS